jgi:hypothetical protein
MLTRPEAADPAVEELKRRARRRLVGAIVLALAAAVILPLLLESDPKPLGDDVSIQIHYAAFARQGSGWKSCAGSCWRIDVGEAGSGHPRFCGRGQAG